MGSSSKKQTIGYWFEMLYHFGWSQGPIDAFLEFRAGDRAAWKGELTGSGRISVNAPNLFGGEKAEGGLVGDFDVMMGEADQQPNDYLAGQLGPEQPAYRGKATGVWRGGRYGAMNPYPKPASFKLRRVLKGWDDDEPWYPERAEIVLMSSSFSYDQDGWRYKVTPPGDSHDYSAADFDDSDWLIGPGGFGSTSIGGLNVGTYVPSGVTGRGIWIRRSFLMTAGQDVEFDIFHDDGATLWWNGELMPLTATDDYYHSVLTIPGGKVLDQNVVALRVLDAVPTGSPVNIFAGLTMRQAGSSLIAMNPAHILYDSLTSREMQGEPVGLINDASFRAAADRFYAEGFGLCTSYEGGDEDIEAFQQRICDVVGACLSQSLIDGQYYLDVIRGDYDVESLPVVAEDDVLEFNRVPSTITELVNQIVVEWFNPETKESRTTAPLQSAGAIKAAGGVRGEKRSYPEIPVESLALRAGARDLQAASTPTDKLQLTINRRAGPFRPGQAYRLQMPSEGISDMVCVVSDYDGGTLPDSRVRINAVQDVFGMPATVYVKPEGGNGQAPDVTPVASPHQRLIEAPYVELVAAMSSADLAALAEDAGLLLALATRPTAGNNYHLYAGGDGEELADAGLGDWCPSAVIAEAADYLDTAFTLAAATDLGRVEVGSWALWGDEIVRVDAIDPVVATLTLGRGCADTLPAKHLANSRIYFCGDWGSTDGREYVEGETVSAKLLTRTSSAEQDLASATAITVEMAQRQYRPYPPARVRINGEAYPDAAYGDIVLQWVWRDRLMQADKLFDAEDDSIGPEPGTTLSAYFYLNDILVHTDTGVTASPLTYTPTGEGLLRIELETVRGGLASLQRFVHELQHGALPWTPAALTVTPKMWFDDGSSVTAVSGAASQWNDRTSNGYHLSQGTAGQRPLIVAEGLGGRRTLKFDGTDDMLVTSATAARDIMRNTPAGWMFCIYKKQATDAGDVYRSVMKFAIGTNDNDRFVLDAGQAAPLRNIPSMGVRRLDANSYASLGGTTAMVGSFCMVLVSMDWQNRIGRVWVNGSQTASNTTLTTAGNTSDTTSAIAFCLGAGKVAGGFAADVEVAAALVGAGSLPTTDEINKLFGWAAWHWGLVDSLPSDHPYKTEAPTI
ncbi:phage tail protein [Pseudomonas sp. 273]|uniref:phage tail protein n=1 Tax=Pseudomonas sp. 273 TaxID=75692 RepID=UPI0023D849AD|nr:phage tail protein [Pseudomonas sp. 273]